MAVEQRTPDYAASCGMCGQDFVFGTSKERNDWFRAHDPKHVDFCSFFRQARAVCPHDSLSGDEGPVSELGRMPVRWRCEACDAIVYDDVNLYEGHEG